MTLSRSLRILLALALLGAQQLALSHQIWHSGKHDSQPVQERLCDQHAALDTVAGALDAPVVVFASEAPIDFAYLFVALPSAATPGLAPSSRGPPTLL
jgi:hypothetical protein